MTSPEKVAAAQSQNLISPEAAQSILKWLNEAKYQEYCTELEQLVAQEQWQVLEDSFFKVVPFGTGGRRGTVGVGSNRINNVTIGESAQGLAQYLLTTDPTTRERGVVVAFDTRLTSVALSELTARVLAANGFKVYLFDGWRATPQLSFAVRHLKTAAGVVISASHNPPLDNGFKAYWSDGGQVVPPHDAGIMEQVNQAQDIKLIDFETAKAQGQIVMVGAEIDEAYTSAVCQESLTEARAAHIVYSPLHGTGSRSVLPVLKKAGFTHLSLVEEQATPDGNFPNIKNNIPNPEVRDTNEAAADQAQAEGADLAITTDPDADRLGVVARDSQGQYQFLTGNQIAALLGFFVLQQMQEQHKLSPHHFMVKTIVTTDFLTAMAKDYNVKLYDQILIGFKYVAELIRLQEGKEEFLFGGEESHGILKGSYTRDKDAAIAALLMAELASYVKDQGRTVIDYLNDLYRRYGIYVETLQNIMYPGAAGSQTMARLMAGLRATPPATVGTEKVYSVIDRQAADYPGTKGDVLIFTLSDDGQTRITVRPSGTEPKLKFYTQIHRPIEASLDDAGIAAAQREAQVLAQALNQAMSDYFTMVLASEK